MNALQNLHTHTTYCDGKDTPREMISKAIEKGFGSIGFSGHSYMELSKEYTMTPESTEEYKNEIKALKKEFDGTFDIFLGIEADVYSDIDLSDYDYSIGSFHFVKVGDELVPFDRSADAVVSVINTYFGGRGLDFAKAYYSQLATMTNYGKYDIIGHLDTITKNIEKADLFDMNSKEYLTAALEGIDALRGKIPFFEVNTGAISRGYRTSPYPAKNLLKELKNMGFGAIISSDCHNADYLDCYFKESAELLAECGFKEKYILTKTGFKAVGLQE